MSTGTFAQAQAAVPAETGQPAAASTSAQSSGDAIMEIVVTAQRRSERLQDVPVSVTAATAERLTAVGIQSSQDLTLITPGLSIPQTSGYTQPHIRGVGTTS